MKRIDKRNEYMDDILNNLNKNTYYSIGKLNDENSRCIYEVEVYINKLNNILNILHKILKHADAFVNITLLAIPSRFDYVEIKANKDIGYIDIIISTNLKTKLSSYIEVTTNDTNMICKLQENAYNDYDVDARLQLLIQHINTLLYDYNKILEYWNERI